MQKVNHITNETQVQSLLHSDSQNGHPSFFKPIIQPKLTINQPGDIYEQEADTVADKVMRIPAAEPAFFGPATNLIQRKCAHCEEEEKLQMKAASSGKGGMTAPSTVNNVISSSGQTLDAGTRDFMESRFGYDFGNVEIHNDSMAHQSSAEINALAYTHGNHVVFGAGQYHPGIDSGRKLLAHELAHVVQQNNNRLENNIHRFSDTDHHVLEEVALHTIFTEEQIKSIELGNMQRDYSQLPAFGNDLLLGVGSTFGGYKYHEHFDHFIFDREKNRWVSHDEYDKIWDDNTGQWIKRTMPVPDGSAAPKTTPLQYIESELQMAVEKDIPDSSAFIHVGDAFHTIEDFFAHSNFVELTKGDYSSGTELTTHPPGVAGTSSVDSILSNVLDPVPASIYKDKFKSDYDKASAVSHGRMAKDFHLNPNHLLAMTLAALVVRQIATMLKYAFTYLKTKELRKEYVQDPIMTTLSGYFRPPSDENKWWEKLLAEDKGLMSKRIKELQDKTPYTVNQDPGSPLRNLEATKFSSWKAIGLGTSFSVPLKDNTYFTVGYMLHEPGLGLIPDDKVILVAPRADWIYQDQPKFIFGAQISGSFDLADLFKK